MLAAKVFVHTWSSLIVFELNWTCFMKYMFCSMHLNWLSALFEFQQYWRTLIVTLVDFGWFSVIRKNGTTKVYFDWMKVDNRLTVLWHRSVGGQQGGGRQLQPLPPKRPGQLNLLSNGSPQSLPPLHTIVEVQCGLIECTVQCNVHSMEATSKVKLGLPKCS